MSVGQSVITTSEIEREIRIAAFLNNEPPDFSAASRRKAADRLVEQKLVQREVQLSRYPVPAAAEAEPNLKRLMARYPTAEAFRLALGKYGIGERELRDYLLWQLTFLRFIDVRFRPGIQITDQEVRDYFEKKILPAAARNPGDPTDLDDYRDKIEQILTAERVDRDLDQWLKLARTRVRVEYREDAFE